MPPLSIAAPAAAASLAYLNAKYDIQGDFRRLGFIINGVLSRKRRDRLDQHNTFYDLEAKALDPHFANKTFIIFEGKSWTYRQLYDNALRYGQWLLITYKVQPNEIVAMDYLNSPEFLFIWMGLWSIGAKPAFINTNLTGTPLCHSIKASSARIVLVDDGVKSLFTKDVVKELTSPNFRDDGGPAQLVYPEPIKSVILAYQPKRLPNQVRSGQTDTDLAMLIYTSGTTGLPKPAFVHWGKVNAVGGFITKHLEMTESDRFYTALPLYHSAASVLAYINVLFGGATLILDQKFSRKGSMRTIREQKATIMQYIGEICRYMLLSPPTPDDKNHNLRVAFGNGLRPDIWDKFKERFNIPVIAEFYGATEGTGSIWNLSKNDFTKNALGRTGKILQLLFGHTVAVAELDDESEQPWRDPQTGLAKRVSTGTAGELLYKLPEDDLDNAFPGYFRNKKASDGKILRSLFAKGDAWYRTGDTVRQDNEGRTFFVDRIGDTFRWKSENVSTNEVGDAVSRHPRVSEANVYGVQIPNHDGRAGCAAIVLDDHKSEEDDPNKQIPEIDTEFLQELASLVQKELPRYAAPIFLRFTNQMDKTGTSKHIKHILRAESVDPEKVKKKGDRLFWLKGNEYVPFTEKEWMEIQGGKVNL